MKFLYLTLLLSSLSLGAWSQDITGSWHGILSVQGAQLRMVFHVSSTNGALSSTMDSPDQGAKDIPVATTTFENKVLTLSAPQLKVQYVGTLQDDGTIKGSFSQSGQSIPVNLSRKEIEKVAPKRPQEPKEPFRYPIEEVSFENKKAGVKLSGTLTLPKKRGKFPVVVLISGSGPQDRNEEILGHKPFWVLADHLTRKGIAVLRYDDRGTAQSTGNFQTATSNDFAEDVEAAVAYLKTRKEIDSKKIGLIGHSEGGLIAPLVASESKDIAFIVLMAGPGIPGYQIMLMQQELIAKANGSRDSEWQNARLINEGLFEMILKHKDPKTIQPAVKKYLEQTFEKHPDLQIPGDMDKNDFIAMSTAQVTSPWMLNFLTYNPVPALESTKCPVLAINGKKDLQVPYNVNLEAIKQGLKSGGNKQVTTVAFENLNHLFQECQTGAPSEYGEIEQTFSPKAMETISAWILKKVKK